MKQPRRAPGVEGLCQTIDDESNDLCRRALRKMGVRPREIGATLDPTHLLAEKAPEWHDFDPGVTQKAEALLAASPVCEHIDPSMSCLSDVASIFIFSPTTVWRDRPIDRGEIQYIRAQLSEMRGAVGSLHTEMRRSLSQVHEDNRSALDSIHQLEALVSGPLTRKIEAALVERCKEDIEKIQEKRIARAQKLLSALKAESPPSLSCTPPPPARPDIIRNGVSVAIDYEAMCDAFKSSYVTFTVRDAALFDSCSCNLSDSPKGKILAHELALIINTHDNADVAKIEVVGHSDPSGIDYPCRRCNDVTENDQLSQYRAQAFANAVKSDLLPGVAEKLEIKGAGSTQPVDGKRCSVGDEECYKKTRRIEARLFLSEGSIDPHACVSSSARKAGGKNK